MKRHGWHGARHALHHTARWPAHARDGTRHAGSAVGLYAHRRNTPVVPPRPCSRVVRRPSPGLPHRTGTAHLLWSMMREHWSSERWLRSETSTKMPGAAVAAHRTQYTQAQQPMKQAPTQFEVGCSTITSPPAAVWEGAPSPGLRSRGPHARQRAAMRFFSSHVAVFFFLLPLANPCPQKILSMFCSFTRTSACAFFEVPASGPAGERNAALGAGVVTSSAEVHISAPPCSAKLQGRGRRAAAPDFHAHAPRPLPVWPGPRCRAHRVRFVRTEGVRAGLPPGLHVWRSILGAGRLSIQEIGARVRADTPSALLCNMCHRAKRWTVGRLHSCCVCSRRRWRSCAWWGCRCPPWR